MNNNEIQKPCPHCDAVPLPSGMEGQRTYCRETFEGRKCGGWNDRPEEDRLRAKIDGLVDFNKFMSEKRSEAEDLVEKIKCIMVNDSSTYGSLLEINELIEAWDINNE